MKNSTEPVEATLSFLRVRRRKEPSKTHHLILCLRRTPGSCDANMTRDLTPTGATYKWIGVSQPGVNPNQSSLKNKQLIFARISAPWVTNDRREITCFSLLFHHPILQPATGGLEAKLLHLARRFCILATVWLNFQDLTLCVRKRTQPQAIAIDCALHQTPDAVHVEEGAKLG